MQAPGSLPWCCGPLIEAEEPGKECDNHRDCNQKGVPRGPHRRYLHAPLPQGLAPGLFLPTARKRGRASPRIAWAANARKTLAYLRQFRSLLTARAAYRRYQDRQPFYSMYNVGPYTLSAAKVIWRRMDHEIRAAVVETWDDPLLGPRPVIPQETCVLIACISGDEAHYLCSLLNSSLVRDLVVAHSVAGGKGFGSPSILDYLPLRKFDPSDGRHVALAALSRQLHALRFAHRPDSGLHAEIDQLAATVLVRRDDLRNLTFDFDPQPSGKFET